MYSFSWDQLGDIAEGRPNLGPQTTVVAYRMMQYSLRAVLEAEYGDERTRSVLVTAGRLAGAEFCKQVFKPSLPLNVFLAQLHQALIDHAVGIFKVEESDPATMNFTVTVSEDLDCSGLPIRGVTVCDYDEGFFEGIFSTYTGHPYSVKETDCWSTGARTCRFTIHPT